MNSLEYNVNFDDGINYGIIYGCYILVNDIMDSNLDFVVILFSGKFVMVDGNGYIIIFIVMEIS